MTTCLGTLNVSSSSKEDSVNFGNNLGWPLESLEKCKRVPIKPTRENISGTQRPTQQPDPAHAHHGCARDKWGFQAIQTVANTLGVK